MEIRVGLSTKGNNPFENISFTNKSVCKSGSSKLPLKSPIKDKFFFTLQFTKDKRKNI